MSEEQQQETSTTETPKIDIHAVQGQILEAVKKELPNLIPKGMEEEERNEIIKTTSDQVRKQIADQISGKAGGESKNLELTKQLLTDTPGVLSALIEEAVDQAVTRISEQTKQEREVQGEEQKAFRKILTERKDILQSDKNKELFNLCYSQENPEDAPTKRTEAALKRYDSLMESMTGKSTADRIKEIGSLGAESTKTSQSSDKKPLSQMETWEAEQKARVERRRKLTGKV